MMLYNFTLYFMYFVRDTPIKFTNNLLVMFRMINYWPEESFIPKQYVIKIFPKDYQ